MSVALPKTPAAASHPRPKLELADIFREHGEDYRRTHRLSRAQLKVMRAIEQCRTAALGGHLEQCDACGFQRPAYNSCRNRHCPKCQSLAAARWLAERQSELLPVAYFHLVFTLPHELNALALSNKQEVCDLLFKAVAETLLEFGRRHLGGKLGVTAVLHTWDQTLRDHFHLHCLIPGGALSDDGSRWTTASRNFLFPVRALSLVLRAKFLDYLKQAHALSRLQFHGRVAVLADPAVFAVWHRRLREQLWVVYAKKPFCSPERVLDYLGRYTHRTAISNHRLLSLEQGRVTFSYRDRRRDNQLRSMTLDADEFIRRFLLHVLPDRFVRIRHFGLLANRSRKQTLARCRQLLGVTAPTPHGSPPSTRELLLALGGADLTRCPICRTGEMVILTQLPAIPLLVAHNPLSHLLPIDTS
jgi:hypothetical protein